MLPNYVTEIIGYPKVEIDMKVSDIGRVSVNTSHLASLTAESLPHILITLTIKKSVTETMQNICVIQTEGKTEINK